MFIARYGNCPAMILLTLDGDVEGESIAAYFVAKFFEENLTWEGINAEIEGYYLGYGDSAQYAYPEKYLEIVHSYREDRKSVV